MSASADLSPILTLGSSGANASDPPEASKLDLLVCDLAQVLGAELALVVEHDGSTAEVVSSWGLGAAISIALPKRRVMRRRTDHPPLRGSFVGRALSHGRPAFEALHLELEGELISAAQTSLTHALAMPVQTPTDTTQRMLVAAFSTQPGDFARLLWVADAYARLIAVTTCYSEALAGLIDHSRSDALTGCLSYQSVLHELTREINRSARGPVPLSCCFIDLDDFKDVNERYGHIHGNKVLAHVGSMLREGVRSCDTVGRYGGDEFIAILPQTRATEAAVLAERLRSAIASEPAQQLRGRMTASVGVAEWTQGISSEQLLARADHALFSAKELPDGVSTYGRADSSGGRRGGFTR